MRHVVSVILLVALSGPLAASGDDSVTHGSNAQDRNHEYSGLQQREIASLSEEELDDLRAGRGMGFALPAELNGYPGPRHVLDLADELGLTGEQIEQTRRLFEDMRQEAIAAGEFYIEREREVDAVFADSNASEAEINAATQAAAEAQGRLRAVHLRYHLKMTELLTRHQIHEYQQGRGYGGESGHHHHH